MTTIIRDQDQERLLQAAGRHLCEKLRAVLTAKGRAILAVPGGRSAATVFDAMLAGAARLATRAPLRRRRAPGAGRPPRQQLQAAARAPRRPAGRGGRVRPGQRPPVRPRPRKRGPRRGALRADLADLGFRYDVVLLSSGEDGHVAALFPGHHSIENRHHGFIVMDDSPKPPPGRMSSSLSLIQTASAAVLIFAGAAKREAYARFNDESCPGTRLPGEAGAGDRGPGGVHRPALDRRAGEVTAAGCRSRGGKGGTRGVHEEL